MCPVGTCPEGAKRPAGYQPKRAVRPAGSSATIEVAELSPKVTEGLYAGGSGSFFLLARSSCYALNSSARCSLPAPLGPEDRGTPVPVPLTLWTPYPLPTPGTPRTPFWEKGQDIRDWTSLHNYPMLPGAPGDAPSSSISNGFSLRSIINKLFSLQDNI